VIFQKTPRELGPSGNRSYVISAVNTDYPLSSLHDVMSRGNLEGVAIDTNVQPI